MNKWEPTKEQLTDWHTRGYFIIRGAIPRDNAIELRGGIKDFLLRPDPGPESRQRSHGPNGRHTAGPTHRSMLANEPTSGTRCSRPGGPLLVYP